MAIGEVKPTLIGEEVIPESLRLHLTIPTQTAAKMARYQKFQPKNAVSPSTSSMETKSTWM